MKVSKDIIGDHYFKEYANQFYNYGHKRSPLIYVTCRFWLGEGSILSSKLGVVLGAMSLELQIISKYRNWVFFFGISSELKMIFLGTIS